MKKFTLSKQSEKSIYSDKSSDTNTHSKHDWRLLLIGFLVSLFLPCCKIQRFQHASEVLRLYLQAEPVSLDPRVGGDRRSQVILRCLFEGLTRIGKNGSIELGMAQSYSVSPDGLVYTFTLKDAFWTNGKRVHAQDFCYAWKTALSPVFSSSYSYIFFVIKNARIAKKGECSLDSVGVRAINDCTLRVELEHPTPYFLELAANPLYSPVCEAAVRSSPRDWSTTCFPKFVSNGPFRLKEHTPRAQIILERNPFYWDKRCSPISRITFPIIEHPSTAFTLFERGELDWFGDPCGLCDLEVIQKLSQEGSLILKESGGLYWLVCNTKKPFLASSKIRCAIASAISRKDLCYLLLKGGEFPANSILPAFLSSLKKPSFSDGDEVYARTCFEQGLKEVGLTHKTFPTITITHWAEPLSRIIAQYLQQKIGQTLHISVELKSCDWATYMQRIPSGEIDLATACWLTWLADPIFNLQYLKFANTGMNGTGWESNSYIQFLEKAENTLSTKKRKAFLQQAEELSAQELPIIPLHEIVYKYTKAPGVSGEVISPVGSFDFKWIRKEKQKNLAQV